MTQFFGSIFKLQLTFVSTSARHSFRNWSNNPCFFKRSTTSQTNVSSVCVKDMTAEKFKQVEKNLKKCKLRKKYKNILRQYKCQCLGDTFEIYVCMYVCMYVFNTYLVSAPLRGFSGANNYIQQLTTMTRNYDLKSQSSVMGIKCSMYSLYNLK